MIDILLVLSVIAGFILGVISGLTPGLHVNNFSALALLVSTSAWLHALGISPYYLAAILVSASVSQPFLDIIPAIFIGTPDEDTAMAVLPGQRMMIEGRGLEAVRLSALGCAGGILATTFMIIPMAMIVSRYYDIVLRYVGPFLLVVAAIMIYDESGQSHQFPLPGERLKYRMMAALVFITSGALGAFAFKYEDMSMYQGMVPMPPGAEAQVMLPLLSGIFGASSLLIGMFTRMELPPQRETQPSLTAGALMRSIILGSLGGAIISWVPGLSPSVSATMTRLGLPTTSEEFLVTLSGVNAANALAPLVMLYFLNRPKSGAAAAIQDLGVLNQGFLMHIFVIAVAVATASYLTTISLGLAAASIISRLNYGRMCLVVLIGITAMVAVMTGWFGLFIFAVSTAVGLAAPLCGIRRAHAMGVLMLPLIIHYI